MPTNRRDFARRLWGELLTDTDWAVLDGAGYVSRGSFAWGRRRFGDRPALIVVDMQKNVVGPDVPIERALAYSPIAMGELAHAAIPSIRRMLESARQNAHAVFFTRNVPPRAGGELDEYAIVPELEPRDGEVVVTKQYASAFYGTPLLSYLVERRIDTVVLAGNSTSGCVRATAVDAQARGYSVVVAPQCTFDRISVSHAVALLDLWMKYALVVDLDDVLEHLRNAATDGEPDPKRSRA